MSDYPVRRLGHPVARPAARPVHAPPPPQSGDLGPAALGVRVASRCTIVALRQYTTVTVIVPVVYNTKL